MEKHGVLRYFLDRKYEIAFFSALAVFLLNCARYSAGLNLWGDEAFYMGLASSSFGDIMKNITNHSPVYPFFLKLVISVAGASFKSEVIVRMVHAVIFAGGLCFGYASLKAVFGRGWMPVLAALYAMLIPGYMFYATNIKMYSLTFLFSMWVIYAVLRLIIAEKGFSAKKNWDIPLAGFLLIISDYTGLLYYFMAAVFVLLKTGNKKSILPAAAVLSAPLVLVALLMGPGFFASIGVIMQLVTDWLQRSIHGKGGTFALASGLFFKAGRPFFELSDISFTFAVFPATQLIFDGIFLLAGTLYIIKEMREKSRYIAAALILASAFLWLATSITGSALTRVFLPSQFFMGAVIIHALFRFNIPRPLKYAGYVMITGFNIFLFLMPAYHLSSIIPYRQIAAAAVAEAKNYGTDKVLLSYNTLNSVSVYRYISNEEKGGGLKITFVGPDFTKNEAPRGKFIFLSFMGEDNKFVDKSRFISGGYSRRLMPVKNFVKLEDLPYNKFWKNHFQNNAMQEYACIVYDAE